MAGAAGVNDHNSRFCRLTFVCRTRGVIHGLAGYFESTLYESQLKASEGKKVEISTHTERIDAKSKDSKEKTHHIGQLSDGLAAVPIAVILKEQLRSTRWSYVMRCPFLWISYLYRV